MMRHRLLISCTLLALVACDRSPIAATVTSAPLLATATRVDTLPGDYTRVVRAAEFHDSLVVLGDVQDARLWRVHVRNGTRDALGRNGAGPGEYRRIGRIARTHTDSIAVFDGFATMPFAVLSVTSGAGRRAEALPTAASDALGDVLLSVSAPYLETADTIGHVYGTPTMGPTRMDSTTRRLRTEPLDVLRIVRYSLDATRVDTVLSAPRGYVDVPASPDASGRLVTRIGLGEYAPTNGWAVLPDGRLLIAEASTYTLTLHRADGRVERRWRVPFDEIRIADSSWTTYLERAQATSRGLLRSSAQAIASATGKGLPAPPDPNVELPEKPENAPPLALGSGINTLHVAGSRVWIPVHLDDRGERPGWDVVDLVRGERIRRFSLPARHRLLLATSNAVYIVQEDADDVERVIRVELALP